MKCTRCNDTGVIETGNNDLPCDCEAGQTAVFNVATCGGVVQMNGSSFASSSEVQKREPRRVEWIEGKGSYRARFTHIARRAR